MITLAAGSFVVELEPEIGGSVASFRWLRNESMVDLLRPMSDEARAKRLPVGAAMFPMVPYANRIADNQFSFGAHDYRFLPNVSGEPCSLHGAGWLSAWTVAHAEAASAYLTLDHMQPDEPYSYSASQDFELTTDGLTVTVGVVNRSTRRLPFGFGLHPWWTYQADITLGFRATHFWLEGPGYLPTDRISLPPELDFSHPKRLPRRWRNNCYSGWDGRAELFLPHGVGMSIQAESVFRHLMVYSDPQKRVFCLEPQTHATGALNRIGEYANDDLGIIILEPGESAQGAVSFLPFSTERR